MAVVTSSAGVWEVAVDASFWFDIYLNFRTAVSSSGTQAQGDYLVTRPLAIAYSYLRVRPCYRNVRQRFRGLQHDVRVAVFLFKLFRFVSIAAAISDWVTGILDT